MKAPIEHDRCTVIEIKIDDKNFSRLSNPADTKMSQRRRKNVLILVSKTS